MPAVDDEQAGRDEEHLPPVTLDARTGTVHADVTAVLDVILDAGWADGAYQPAVRQRAAPPARPDSPQRSST